MIMTKSTLGDLVAAEMNKIVDSEEHVSMFSKVAKKREDKKVDESDKKDEKSEKSDKKNPFTKSEKSDSSEKKDKKSNPFAKKDKKDDEEDEEDEEDKEDKDDKDSKKKDKKSDKKDKKDDKSDKKDKKDKKDDKESKKEITSESMATLVNILTKASDTLDGLGLQKSSALTLRALDTLINEVAVTKFAGGPEDLSGQGLDDFMDDPELRELLNMGRGGHNRDSDGDAALELELAGIDTGEGPTNVFDDIDEDDDGILAELGLGEDGDSDEEHDPLEDTGSFIRHHFPDGELPDGGLETLPEVDANLDEDTRKVFGRLDSWMAKHAHDEDAYMHDHEPNLDPNNGGCQYCGGFGVNPDTLEPCDACEGEKESSHEKSLYDDEGTLDPAGDSTGEDFMDHTPQDIDIDTIVPDDGAYDADDEDDFEADLRALLENDEYSPFHGKGAPKPDRGRQSAEEDFLDRMGPLGDDHGDADDDEEFEDE